jgi:vancomycin resistance protein YoaR
MARAHHPATHRTGRARAVLGVIVTTLALAALAALAVIALGSAAPSHRIPRNIRIAGLDVGGYTDDEALEVLRTQWAAQLPGAVTLTWPGGSAAYPRSELGVSLRLQEAVKAAVRLGEEGGLLARARRALGLPGSGTNISVKAAVELTRLRATLQSLKAKVERPATDAEVTVSGGEVRGITPEEPGLELDLQASTEALTRALADTSARSGSLVVRTIEPSVRAADLERVDTVLAAYTTRFQSWKKDRSHNVRLAASQLRCIVLMPGDTVSLNNRIGPRLEKLGYRDAPIFVNGEVEPSTGGGICQVATTVYNAVLLADLDVLERHHHSRPVDYAPSGRDATLYWGQCDLRVRNSLRAPVVLTASAGTGGTLTVRVLGNSADRTDVSIGRSGVSSIPHGAKEQPDPTLPAGQRKVDKPGRNGARVTVTRLVKGADGVVKRETLHTDVYAPADEVVRVGTQPPALLGNQMPGNAVGPAALTTGAVAPADAAARAPAAPPAGAKRKPTLLRPEPRDSH